MKNTQKIYRAPRAYKLHVVQRGPTPDGAGHGKGRPVILLHGALSTHRYWNRVSEVLDNKRCLLLPDLLGFGRSPKPRRAEYSMDQFVACLEHTFKDYKFEQKPILAGHSMGANIALRWAIEQPDKFSAVVLSSPLLFDQPQFHQQLATIPLEGKWIASKTLAQFVVFAMGMSRLVPTQLAVRFANGRPKYVIEDVTSQRFFVFRKLLKNTYFRDDVLAEIAQAKLPTRIFIADQDLIANHAIEELKKVCKQNTYCNIQVLPGSHQILLEHPETVARVIESL